MTATGFPTGTVTFLFTDIEGSTRLWESQPEAMRAALPAHDAIVRAAVETHRGVVFKTVGDAFCAVFVRPEDALAAGVQAQRRLAEHAWPAPIDLLRVRMGIHTGTAVETGGDYFGPTVNRVARFMSIGYGEQILVSGAAAALLRDTLAGETALRDLGTHRLKDLAEPEPTYQVLAPGLRDDFPALKSIDRRPNNLPFQISSFVGRQQELREAREALHRHRLVTVVGPGGIGKSRLALHVAGEMIDDFDDGVWLVELAPLKNAALIAQAAASALRVREQGQERIDDTLARSLADKHALLLLDNAEHVVAGTAAFVKTLLNRCANVRVLVTSRELLHVTGENVVRVDALSNAADLFRERAREVAPDLEFGAEESGVVADICRRVEGVPLAIELAAARVATLSIRELDARLSRRLNVLVSRDSTTEERHRTLRGTISWSYDLLDEPESATLRTLAVFDGKFDIAAVSAVTARTEEENLDLVDALAGKSLVSVQTGPRATYSLLGTVRDYLLERVTADGSLPDLQRRHFFYYAGTVTAATSRDATHGVGLWLDAIDADISNLRAALEWGLRERPSEAASMVTLLARYWRVRGHVTEGRAWFRRFLANPAIGDAARAAILRRAATFATEQDDYDEALALSTACRSLYEQLHDLGGVAEALHTLAVIEQRGGRMREAAEHYRSAITTFREAGNDSGEAATAVNLALLALAEEDPAAAQRWTDEAAAVAERIKDDDLRGHVLGLRGQIALRRGELDEAAKLHRSALDVKRALGHRYDVGDLQNSLAFISLLQNDVAGAVSSARETLQIALELDAVSLAIYGFEAFCEIGVFEARYTDAARCLAIAQSLRHDHSYQHQTARRMTDLTRKIASQLGERFASIVAECVGTDWRLEARALMQPA